MSLGDFYVELHFVGAQLSARSVNNNNSLHPQRQPTPPPPFATEVSELLTASTLQELEKQLMAYAMEKTEIMGEFSRLTSTSQTNFRTMKARKRREELEHRVLELERKIDYCKSKLRAYRLLPPTR